MKIPKDLTKLYYSIGEVAEMFDVNKSLLRFWEKEFSILKPKKSKRGIRQFTKKDIETIKCIYQLIKIKGYTIEGAKSRLRNIVKSKNIQEELIKRLEKISNDMEKVIKSNI